MHLSCSDSASISLIRATLGKCRVHYTREATAMAMREILRASGVTTVLCDLCTIVHCRRHTLSTLKKKLSDDDKTNFKLWVYLLQPIDCLISVRAKRDSRCTEINIDA